MKWIKANLVAVGLGIAVVAGIVITSFWCCFQPTATFEFGREKLPDGTFAEPSLYVQVDAGDKLVFVNNDAMEEQKLAITFDAGSLEPGQLDPEASHKLIVEPGESGMDLDFGGHDIVAPAITVATTGRPR